jgi:hypothetical protein
MSEILAEMLILAAFLLDVVLCGGTTPVSEAQWRHVCCAGSTGISTLRAATSSHPSSLALRGGSNANITLMVTVMPPCNATYMCRPAYKKTPEKFEVEVQEDASVLDLKRQLAILKCYPASEGDLKGKTAMKIIHLGKILSDHVAVASLVHPPSPTMLVMLPPKTRVKTTARDLEYEQAHLAQNPWSEDGEIAIKCKNFDLCEALLPMWWWDCKGCYICTWCDMTFGGPVIFKEVKDECAICLETTIKQAQITAHCSHWFCVPCARKLLGCDEEFLKRYELSMVPYGCPPCPNGCTNPVQGVQCHCKEYTEIYDQWCEECPEQSHKHCIDEELSVDSNKPSRRCPLCRASLE